MFYTPNMAQESPGYVLLPLRAITHHTTHGRARGWRRSCGRACAGAALACFEWDRANFESGYVFCTPDMAQGRPGYAALPPRAITHHPPHTRPCAGLAALMRLEGMRARLRRVLSGIEPSLRPETCSTPPTWLRTALVMPHCPYGPAHTTLPTHDRARGWRRSCGWRGFGRGSDVF